MLSDCGLLDMDLIGYPFTWEYGTTTRTHIEERLDKALVREEWRFMFPQAKLVHPIIARCC